MWMWVKSPVMPLCFHRGVDPFSVMICAYMCSVIPHISMVKPHPGFSFQGKVSIVILFQQLRGSTVQHWVTIVYLTIYHYWGVQGKVSIVLDPHLRGSTIQQWWTSNKSSTAGRFSWGKPLFGAPQFLETHYISSLKPNMLSWLNQKFGDLETFGNHIFLMFIIFFGQNHSSLLLKPPPMAWVSCCFADHQLLPHSSSASSFPRLRPCAPQELPQAISIHRWLWLNISDPKGWMYSIIK